MGHGQSKGGLGWRSLEQGDWAESAPHGCVSSQEQTGLNHVTKLTPTVQRRAWAASFGGANGLEYLRVT